MSGNDRQAWLFTTHSPREIFSGYRNIDTAQDLLIAVDGGLKQLDFLGLTPNLVIGDFDSVDPELLQRYQHCLRIQHPTAKNETDTELAILWALDQGVRRITVCNDCGGRIDHALALIQNLDFLKSRGCSGSIESSAQRLFFLDRDTHFTCLEGHGLSLLAWRDEAEFLSSEGLLYPLEGVKLNPLNPRGMSNQILSANAQIRLIQGKVLAILSKPAL